jgi:hypothetical protein
MPYTFNTKDAANTYGLIDEGKYEVFIKEALIKTTINGKEKIAIQFKIRDDVQQKFQNRVIFEDIWKERETEFFNRKRLNQLLGTQSFEDGKTFDSIQDLLQSLKGINLVIKVNKEMDDYKNEEVNSVYFYESSKHKPKTIAAPKEIKDEDLPF